MLLSMPEQNLHFYLNPIFEDNPRIGNRVNRTRYIRRYSSKTAKTFILKTSNLAYV